MLFKRNPEIIGAELDDEICAFIPSSAEYITLNETASSIYKMIENPLSTDEIIQNLSRSYNLDEQIAFDEVKNFLEYGISIGLIICD